MLESVSFGETGHGNLQADHQVFNEEFQPDADHDFEQNVVYTGNAEN